MTSVTHVVLLICVYKLQFCTLIFASLFIIFTTFHISSVTANRGNFFIQRQQDARVIYEI